MLLRFGMENIQTLDARKRELLETRFFDGSRVNHQVLRVPDSIGAYSAVSGVTSDPSSDGVMARYDVHHNLVIPDLGQLQHQPRNVGSQFVLSTGNPTNFASSGSAVNGEAAARHCAAPDSDKDGPEPMETSAPTVTSSVINKTPSERKRKRPESNSSSACNDSPLSVNSSGRKRDLSAQKQPQNLPANAGSVRHGDVRGAFPPHPAARRQGGGNSPGPAGQMGFQLKYPPSPSNALNSSLVSEEGSSHAVSRLDLPSPREMTTVETLQYFHSQAVGPSFTVNNVGTAVSHSRAVSERISSSQTELTTKMMTDLESQRRSKIGTKVHETKELKREKEDMEKKLDGVTKSADGFKNQVSKCLDVVKTLLVEKSTIEKKEIRRKCMQNRLRLGQFVTTRIGSTFQDTWQDGYAFTDMAKRQTANQELRDAIERARKNLSKKKEGVGLRKKIGASSSGAYSSGSNSNDGFLKPEGPDRESALSHQQHYEQDEILKLRANKFKKEDTALQIEMEKLERERNLHIREMKRIMNEDQSRFNKHPVLCDRYLLLMLLGKGGFSEVHKAFDLKEQRYVACKIHELNKDWKDEKKANYIKHALREYNIHKTLEHPRIVRLYDVFEIDANSFCTVLEYCDGHDLDFYLKQHKVLSEREAKSIIMQVVSALKYLNEIKPPVIHYDLKPGNILLTEGEVFGEIKITDFGLSKIMDEENYNPDFGMDLTSQGAGTYWYLPPECFVVGKNPPKISSKVDVWSVGVIFYQCLYGRKPFGHNQSQATILEQNTILKATEVIFPAKPAISQQAKEFVKCCLQYKKEDRIEARGLAEHGYLKPPAQKKAGQKAQQQQLQHFRNSSPTNGTASSSSVTSAPNSFSGLQNNPG